MAVLEYLSRDSTSSTLTKHDSRRAAPPHPITYNHLHALPTTALDHRPQRPLLYRQVDHRIPPALYIPPTSLHPHSPPRRRILQTSGRAPLPRRPLRLGLHRQSRLAAARSCGAEVEGWRAGRGGEDEPAAEHCYRRGRGNNTSAR